MYTRSSLAGLQVDSPPLLVHRDLHAAADAAGGFPSCAVLCRQVPLVGLVAVCRHDPAEQVGTQGGGGMARGMRPWT